MEYYAIVCNVEQFNPKLLKNKTVYYGAIFLKSDYSGYPNHIPDLLEWKTPVFKTYGEALDSLSLELFVRSYSVKGHKINLDFFE